MPDSIGAARLPTPPAGRSGKRSSRAQLRVDGEERLAWLLQAISDALSAFDESGKSGNGA